MTEFLWGVFPYVCFSLFFSVPILRMAYRPYAWTTRASGMFSRQALGFASLLLHWGLLALILGHVVGWIGGAIGAPRAVTTFYWVGLIGGVLALLGATVALVRRIAVPELRAISQHDDYLVLVLLIGIMGTALYQVIADRVFGVSYTAAAWFSSIWSFAPQPELMASASLLSKIHVVLALLFFAYFPFTKLVHALSFPINYVVRPYQSMRTARSWARRQWEFGLRTDNSFLVYALSGFVLVALAISLLLEAPASTAGVSPEDGAVTAQGVRKGYALYLNQCARCHGTEGRGDGPGMRSPAFASLPRDLTSGRYRFVSTVNGVASEADLRRTVRDGLPSAGMPPFDRLSETQIDSVVTAVEAMWVNRPPSGAAIIPPPRPATTADAVAQGAELYAEACAACHGPNGAGGGSAGTAIESQRGEVILPANLAAGEIKARHDPAGLYTRIRAGVPDGPDLWLMPPADWMSPEEIWTLVDYLETEILPFETQDSAVAARGRR